MARPRTPNGKADATGQSQKNKKRYAARKTPGKNRPLGDAPSFFSLEQILAWECYKDELPWLHESDRALVEMASCLRAQFWENPTEFGINRMKELRLQLSLMGGSPADLSKVYRPDDEEEQDPGEAYFN